MKLLKFINYLNSLITFSDTQLKSPFLQYDSGRDAGGDTGGGRGGRVLADGHLGIPLWKKISQTVQVNLLFENSCVS